MVKIIIKRVEKENLPNQNLSYYIYFDFYGKEQFAHITQKALRFHQVESVVVGDYVDVIPTFKKEKVFYLVTKIYNGTE